MADRWNVLVTLSYGDDEGPCVQVYVPVDDHDDLNDIDKLVERAERSALDALRPFLNNRTHFDASVYLPLVRPAATLGESNPEVAQAIIASDPPGEP
jgi:hypothetical protein